MDFIVRSSTTKKGQPRFLSSISCLVLGLASTRTCVSYFSLNNFRINSWFLECLVEVFMANDCQSAVEFAPLDSAEVAALLNDDVS